MAQRIKTVQESDLRMLGDLARSIQRVLPVTQADIDAAAALGKGWVVTRVFEVSEPLDNLRGGTQLVIRQNSILPGQSVQRVLIVSGPGGQTVVIRGTDYIVLPDAIANSLSYVKAFGGTEQRNIPQPYTQVNYVTNTAQTAVNTGIMIDFAKNYEFEVECRAVGSSWYILQSRASSTGNITGIHGATSGSTITLVVGNVTVCTSAITRTVGNKLYVKATLNAGTATLYVKDETANTEDTQTGSYGTSQPNPTAAVYLLGNAGGQYVDVNSDIYMARIKENDTVVMDYVPARQVASAGFYDAVSGTFKTAETPANLSADGNTVPTPDAPMDIVSNNGVLKFNRVFKSFNGNIGSTGVVGTATSFLLHVAKVEPGKTYKVNNVSLYGFFTTEPEIGSVTYNESRIVTSVTTITVPNDNNIKYIGFRNTADGVLYSDDEPIYADGTVETINVHGKNLVNKNDTASIGNWYNSSNKIAVAVANETIVMRAKPGATYYYKHCSVTGGGRAFYTEVEDWTVGSDCSAMSGAPTIDKDAVKSITVSENAKWVFFNYGRTGQTATFKEQLADFMVSLTPLTSDTQYVPYYDGGTATAEMLLSIDEYTDEQEVISGNITRKVGVLVLDGVTEGRKLTPTWNTTYKRGNLTVPTIKQTSYLIADCACTHFPYSTNTQGMPTSPGFCSRSQDKLVLFTFAGMSNITSSSDANAWLADQYAAGTPVIVIYPLAEPTTESVAGQTLQVTDGDNTLTITQAGMSGLELEAKYQAAVTLTVEEVEDANLDNNVEVTIS